MRRLLTHFGPPLALMALIFALSAQPDLGTGLGTLDLLARKVAHMAVYALLWLLWVRALGPSALLPAAGLTVAYAVSDELHQTMVAGRVGSPVDVLIDAAGVAIAWVAWHRRPAARSLGRPG
jgi:VanZ family protein